MYGTFIQCQHAAVHIRATHMQGGEQNLPTDQGVQNKIEA